MSCAGRTLAVWDDFSTVVWIQTQVVFLKAEGHDRFTAGDLLELMDRWLLVKSGGSIWVRHLKDDGKLRKVSLEWLSLKIDTYRGNVLFFGDLPISKAWYVLSIMRDLATEELHAPPAKGSAKLEGTA